MERVELFHALFEQRGDGFALSSAAMLLLELGSPLATGRRDTLESASTLLAGKPAPFERQRTPTGLPP